MHFFVYLSFDLFFGSFRTVNSIIFHNLITPITPKTGVTASLYSFFERLPERTLKWSHHFLSFSYLSCLSVSSVRVWPHSSQFSQCHPLLLRQIAGGLRVVLSAHVPARVGTSNRLAKPHPHYVSIYRPNHLSHLTQISYEHVEPCYVSVKMI